MIFLLVIIAIWFFGYLFFRFLLPWLITRYVRKMSKHMDAYENHNDPANKKKEGEINIDYVPEKDESTDDDNDDEGEYVDFEEIEE